jgi:hypothetical protein
LNISIRGMKIFKGKKIFRENKIKAIKIFTDSKN